MKQLWIVRVLLVVLGVVMTGMGCSAVYTVEPVGQTPLDISRESGEWAGLWQHNDGVISVVVKDASNGVLEIGWVDHDDNGMKLLAGEVFLRTIEGSTFASLRMHDEKDEAKGLLWGRIQRRGKTVLVWSPDKSEFESRVEAGVFPGTTNGSDLVLGALDTNHLGLIVGEDALFEWKEPLVFWKTSD